MPKPKRAAAEIPEAIAHPDWQGILEAALTVEGSVGNTYRRLYDYSFGNIAFLLYQGVTPQPVATFDRWKQVGRHVTAGAKAFYVLRPITVKVPDQVDAEGNPTMIQRFKPVKSVFPVSMTDGEPLPDLELPDWSKAQALAEMDISEVPFEHFSANVQGYSYGRNLAINPVAAFPEKTLMHELGHIVLGHTVDTRDPAEEQHLGTSEAEAESTGHLALNEIGLMTPEAASVSRAYIASWLAKTALADRSIRSIFKAADTIVTAGRPPIERSDNYNVNSLQNASRSA